jgi:hypothetical protein
MEIIFGTRSDSKFSEKQYHWQGVASLLVQAQIDIPKQGYTLTVPPMNSSGQVANDSSSQNSNSISPTPRKKPD